MVAMDKENPSVKRPVGMHPANAYVIVNNTYGDDLSVHPVCSAICLPQITGTAALEEQVLCLPSEFCGAVVHRNAIANVKRFWRAELCFLLNCKGAPVPWLPCEDIHLIGILLARELPVFFKIRPRQWVVVLLQEVGDFSLPEPVLIMQAIAAQNINQFKFPF